MTRRDRGEVGRRTATRRGALSIGVAGLLAGCLVTTEDEGGVPPSEQVDDGNSDGDDGSGDGDASESDGAGDGGSNGGDESDDADGGSDGGNGGSDGDDGGSDAPDETGSDGPGPDGSGLVVTDTRVRDVTERGGVTTVEARLTVENAGRFAYGTVAFRVDAYAVRPGSGERVAVGEGYVSDRFPSANRFDDGTRRFDATIQFDSTQSPVRPETDRYAVDAAVRRAEPV